ncbi:exo-alpha-sialidase [Bacteroides sp. K03]|uniref:sialidase family protein n=1 Tax=Bacteroides sp. K03 TaxID=2718928 RepID=UPI002102F8C8|nr:sialidase family protein [Bacteroides sp. K03]
MGSLVVVADRCWDKINDLPVHIDVVSRRSEDNGRTWSETVIIAGEGTTVGYEDPAIVLDRRTGHLLCIFTSGNGLWQLGENSLMRINISKSVNNGKTWDTPVDITSQVYGKDCPDKIRRYWYGAFASSGRALQLQDGRIMFCIAVRTTSDWGGLLSNYVCYSDDGGSIWKVSENAADNNGDEAKLIELNNGDIMRYSTIKEGALKNIILHSIPDDNRIRQNVSVLLSYDEGRTWSVKKTILSGLSAYSSMTVLPDGTIGIVVEEGKWDDSLPGTDGFKLWFVRFTLGWLMSEN